MSGRGRAPAWAAVGAGLLALSSSLAVPHTASFGPVRLLRGPGGRPLREAGLVLSQNWSGYVLPGYRTGETYTEAQGTWTVPAVAPPPGYPAGWSSTWVGIGGFCLQAPSAGCQAQDTTLIQIGTSGQAGASGASYSAWYELLPRLPVPIPVPIQPGDRVTASLAEEGAPPGRAPAAWTLTLAVTTPAGDTTRWSRKVRYRSSLASAEWIEEAPTVSGRIAPLADFGRVVILASQADGTPPPLASAERLVLEDPSGQVASPSLPASQSPAFQVCFGSSPAAPPQCPAPGS